MGWHATAVAFLLEEGIRAFGRAYCLPSSVFLVGASFADGSKVGVVLALLMGCLPSMAAAAAASSGMEADGGHCS